MTRLLRRLLKENYLMVVKESMLKHHWNNTTLSRKTGYSKAHIGNLLAGNGSDDALASVCQALSIDIRTLLKGFPIDDGNTSRTDDSNSSDQGSGVHSALSPVPRLTG